MSDQLTTTHSPDEVRDAVRERYAAAARASMAAADDAGCGCGTGCCGTTQVADPISADLYDPADVPSEGALAASLGCGNPTALAELHAGEDVLDLGSGGGLDVLLSARRVAPGGTAFGVDISAASIKSPQSDATCLTGGQPEATTLPSKPQSASLRVPPCRIKWPEIVSLGKADRSTNSTR